MCVIDLDTHMNPNLFLTGASVCRGDGNVVPRLEQTAERDLQIRPTHVDDAADIDFYGVYDAKITVSIARS